VKNLLPIGRFSKVCRLTVKALRHYDELGLLRPAGVDPESGYRYYSVSQAAEAERIRLLRSLEMPLEEIRERLCERDPAAARVRLERHRQRLEQQLAEQQQALAFLRRLIEQEGTMTAPS
jgi:DNA-binding transcriptional MerR regulator